MMGLEPLIETKITKRVDHTQIDTTDNKVKVHKLKQTTHTHGRLGRGKERIEKRESGRMREHVLFQRLKI